MEWAGCAQRNSLKTAISYLRRNWEAVWQAFETIKSVKKALKTAKYRHIVNIF
jgi:prefoldin subunit 5